MDNFVCFFADGMIRGMLEPHLRKEANATQTDIGVTFFIQGGIYMISNPIAGMVRKTKLKDLSKMPTVYVKSEIKQ